MPHRSFLIFLLVSLLAVASNAFAPITTTPPRVTTQLNERIWNFNEGRSPWGLKKNAEIWNGRVAQV
jgi:hypothetical protein